MFLGKFLRKLCLVFSFSRFLPQCFYNVYKKGSYKKETKTGFMIYGQRAPRNVEMLKKCDVILRLQVLLQY